MTLLCASPQIFVVAERTRSDLAISLTKSMLLFQLIPVSLRQIPKTSRKVTNLSAESLTVPRAQLMAIFHVSNYLASQWRNPLMAKFRVLHDLTGHT